MADANERDRRARMPRAKCARMREMWRFRKEAARPGALNVSAPRSHGWKELAGHVQPFAIDSLFRGRQLSQGRAWLMTVLRASASDHSFDPPSPVAPPVCRPPYRCKDSSLQEQPFANSRVWAHSGASDTRVSRLTRRVARHVGPRRVRAAVDVMLGERSPVRARHAHGGPRARYWHRGFEVAREVAPGRFAAGSSFTNQVDQFQDRAKVA